MEKQLRQVGLKGKRSWEEGGHIELPGILHLFPSRYLLIQRECNTQLSRSWWVKLLAVRSSRVKTIRDSIGQDT